MKVKDYIKKLETYDQETEIINVEWGEDDIRERANWLKIELTAEQISEIISFLERTHDGAVGLNWEHIELAIYAITEG